MKTNQRKRQGRRSASTAEWGAPHLVPAPCTESPPPCWQAEAQGAAAHFGLEGDSEEGAGGRQAGSGTGEETTPPARPSGQGPPEGLHRGPKAWGPTCPKDIPGAAFLGHKQGERQPKGTPAQGVLQVWLGALPSRQAIKDLMTQASLHCRVLGASSFGKGARGV